MTNETQFVAAADAVLRRVCDGLTAAAGDAVTCELAGDLLSMRFAGGSKCTLIKQTPIQQVWLSDGVLATYFDWRPGRGEWVDPRRGATLAKVLPEVLARHLGRPVTLALGAPV